MTKVNYKKVLEANKQNTEMLSRIVSEVTSWNGGLDGYEVMEFDDDFFNTYFESKPEEAARATFFGNIQNWLDDYIRFNGYGNLESLNSYQRDQELLEGADEIISAALDEVDNIDMDFITEGLEA